MKCSQPQGPLDRFVSSKPSVPDHHPPIGGCCIIGCGGANPIPIGGGCCIIMCGGGCMCGGMNPMPIGGGCCIIMCGGGCM